MLDNNKIGMMCDVERSDDVVQYNNEILDARIILIVGTICEQTVNDVICEIEQLRLKNNETPITMIINSRGGNAYDVLSIMEYMRTVQVPIYTKTTGYAFSGAAAILTQGEIGHRYMTKNSFIMLHELQVNIVGSMQYIDKEYKQHTMLSNSVFDLIFDRCGITTKAEKKKFFEEYVLQEKYITAKEAKKLGLIDKIV